MEKPSFVSLATEKELIYKVMIEYIFNDKTIDNIADMFILKKTVVSFIIDKFIDKYRTEPDFANEILNFKYTKYENIIWSHIEHYLDFLLSEEQLTITDIERKKICDEIERLQKLYNETKKQYVR